MFKHTLRLMRLSMCNYFDLNRVRHSGDRKDKRRLMWLVSAYFLIAFFLEAYVIGTVWGYLYVGIGEVVPIYAILLSTVVVFIVSYMRAGSMLFRMNTYETMKALPIRKEAILLSRYLEMYVVGLLMTACVMLPAMLLYGAWMHMGAFFYLTFFLAIFFTPLLPLSVSVGVSALIKALTAKMKYKSLAEALLMVGLASGVILFNSNVNYEDLTAQKLDMLVKGLMDTLRKTYFGWLEAGTVQGDTGKLLLFLGVNAAAFLALVVVLSLCFEKICAAVRATGATHQYKKVVGKQDSLLHALVMREFRYYLSCSVYIMNTIMGPVMMVALSVSVCLMDLEKLQQMLPVPLPVRLLLPYLLSLCAILVPTTLCSVSLEGKQRWITKSLPISTKLQYDSKILMNLMVAAPFYVVSTLIAAIGLHYQGLELVWLFVLPAVCLLFGANLGIALNLKFPRFDWDTETQVVKQGAALMINLLCSMAVILLLALFMLLAPSNMRFAVMVNTVILLLAASMLLYRRNKKINL